VDLQLFVRVLWRFRFVVLIGLGAAVAAAFLLFVRVELGPSGEPRLFYRENEEWSVTSTLLVTQPGFPWGRSILDANSDEVEAVPPAETTEARDEFADPTRFSTLAPLYARLATSGAVHRLMLRDGPVDGEIEARPVLLVDNSSVTLPLVELVVSSDTPEGAMALTGRAIDAFDTFLSNQQAANSVPADERVIVTVVDRPDEAELSQPRPLTLAIVAFLGAILTTLAVVFALENLWPRASVPRFAEAPPQRSA
jgi:hypothetical protein